MAEASERWQVGEATVTAVVESEIGGIPPNIFFPEATPAEVEAEDWLAAELVAGGTIALRVQAFVIELAGRTILVDPCVGNGKQRAMPFWHEQDYPWLERFEAAGFTADQIDLVVHTHLHADHVGWDTQLEEGAWVPRFTNARHLYIEAELEHWRAAERRQAEDVYADSVAPIFDAGLADVVAVDADLGDGLRIVPTPGHTPGHVSLELVSAGETAFVTGDFTHHQIQTARPEWAEIADSDVELARRTRRDVFAHCADREALVFGTHWPVSPVGRVEPHDSAWRFRAEPGEEVGEATRPAVES